MSDRVDATPAADPLEILTRSLRALPGVPAGLDHAQYLLDCLEAAGLRVVPAATWYTDEIERLHREVERLGRNVIDVHDHLTGELERLRGVTADRYEPREPFVIGKYGVHSNVHLRGAHCRDANCEPVYRRVSP